MERHEPTEEDVRFMQASAAAQNRENARLLNEQHGLINELHALNTGNDLKHAKAIGLVKDLHATLQSLLPEAERSALALGVELEAQDLRAQLESKGRELIQATKTIDDLRLRHSHLRAAVAYEVNNTTAGFVTATRLNAALEATKPKPL